MQENLISLEQINFGYDSSKLILKNLSMHFRRGQVIAIMGGSGCGKTTILRLISGQLRPQSGRLTCFGQEPAKLNAQQLQQLRKKMGILFQFGALFTDMNVASNVAFPLQEHTNLNQRLIQRLVAMKLEAVGLGGTQELMPRELSGGMARRVALARAIALDPELMLYDEPFTGLDPISLSTTAMLIKKLTINLGQTAILVTHDIEATMAIADYMYFLAHGEVIAAGTPAEIRANPNPAVTQFIRGAVDGPFSFKYAAKHSYEHYLGIA